APLFQPVDASLDPVAFPIDGFVGDEGTSWSSRLLHLLVGRLWSGMGDLPLAQHSTTARIAVAFGVDESVRSGSQSPASCSAWGTNALQDELKLCTVMEVPWGDYNGERSSAPVTGEMELGGQSATAAPQPLVGGMRDPFFSSA